MERIVLQDAPRKLIAARAAMGPSDSRLNDYLGRGIVRQDLQQRAEAA